MYLRVDPSRSAGTDYFILDSDYSLDDLQNRSTLPCAEGGHQRLKSAKLVTPQPITCAETGALLYTLIYAAQS